MPDMNTIVEFPEELAAKAKSDAAEFRAKGTLSGDKPKWNFDRQSDHIDAGESLFVARQLEYIRAGVQKVQYAELVYDELLPINRSVGPGKNEYIVRIQDQAGEAKVV